MGRCGDCGGGILDGYRCDNCGDYTCEGCFEYLPSKGLIVTKHKCPHCDEWALLDHYE